MPSQVDYYDAFAKRHRDEILSCPEPHLWTTDYNEKGRVYCEMKERIGVQESLVDEHFDKDLPVLDVGCGFGRQAYLLAKKSFAVTGTDTSRGFVEIARALFEKHKLRCEFICADILNNPLPQSFPQILLLDVLEHVPPGQRKAFIQKLNALTSPNGVIILSLPHVKKRFTSQVNNRLRKPITQRFAFFRNLEEHPYPIPQEREILALTKPMYKVEAFQHTGETDYYVLSKS